MEEAGGDIIHAEGVQLWFHIIRAAGAQDSDGRVRS
jgi:hypothetical protein